METSILGLASFPCYTTPNSSRLNLRISLSMRHEYPLASKIVVRNLPYFTRETALQKEFSNFGKIAEVQMVKDAITKRSKGLAFIQYTCQDDAMLALENMDQKNFYGRMIFVELAKPGWDNIGIPPRPPRASGPPKKWNLPEEQGEEVDCWY
ncbi:organelle RRM domain-containing protein 6, chloroplastic isoform X2 [Trifolium pratense]|uniref:organelle RRM domain-containing protein 6, chloroplastic isoform X2 n=1 Tax=Trifolium pratense TaxID=57577 RepID=UPI001E6928D9|nr:organelle RRM domain-containing protein 6, chloroplastic isoform X2 [Trifolium pratense]